MDNLKEEKIDPVCPWCGYIAKTCTCKKKTKKKTKGTDGTRRVSSMIKGHFLFDYGRDGMSLGNYYRFGNPKTLSLVCVTQEDLDDEELANVLGMDLGEMPDDEEGFERACSKKGLILTGDFMHKVKCKNCGTEIEISNTRFKRFGKDHPLWKGNNVHYTTIHQWIKRHKPKSDTCEHCGRKVRLDAANISGEYKKDISDYIWLCRKCHAHQDDRTEKISKFAKSRKRKHGRWV